MMHYTTAERALMVQDWKHPEMRFKRRKKISSTKDNTRFIHPSGDSLPRIISVMRNATEDLHMEGFSVTATPVATAIAGCFTLGASFCAGSCGAMSWGCC